jgi:hypothetical protein
LALGSPALALPGEVRPVETLPLDPMEAKKIALGETKREFDVT